MSATNWLNATRKMALGLAAGAAMAGVNGCGVGSVAAPSGVAPVVGALHLRGKAMGGQQAVYNTTIQIWAAGMATGYGQGATPLIAGTVTTGQDGTFSITGDYTCPTPDPQVYITATGGNPTGDGTTTTNNSNLKLVAALGSCATLKANASTTTVNINEVTTAAAAFALAQFYGGFGTATDIIGSPSTNVAGLVNAFATAHNLASTSTGVATPTSAASGTNYYLSQNDNAKVNTIANILADCVNQATSNSTTCGNLFAYVTPKYAPLSTSATAIAPVNTFQAAVYMNLNPLSVDSSGTSNLTNLFNMQSAFVPFAPNLSAAPTDWTLALNYTGTGIALLSGVAIDSSGNVWGSNASTAGGMVVLNGGTGNAGGTAGTTGGFIGYYTSAPGYPAVVPNGSRTIAIDQNDEAWVADFGQTATTPNSNGYYMFRASSTGMDSYYKIPSGTTAAYGIAVDPTNKVITTTTASNVAYTSATATLGANATAASVEGTGGNNSLAITPGGIGYVATSGGALYVINTAGVTATLNIPVATTGFSTPYGNAVDGSNRLWTTNQGNSSLTLYDPTQSTPFTPITAGTCLKTPEYIAIDGNNNVWVSNGATVATNDFGVCEFNSAGALISNSIGYHLHGIATGRGIAVDRSGNVWVTSYVSTGTNITQIVGAAVPAVTPLSVAVKNATIGTRP